MDERGAGVPWHVLEGVPAGREELPGLLRGLVTFGQRRHAWLRLEKKLGWRTDDPLFAHTASHLFELLPALDERRLVQALGFLARRGFHAARSSAGVHYMGFTVFANAGRHVLPLLTHPAAGARAGAAFVLREIRCEDPAALDVLRRQASAEDDLTALISQLLAVGTLSRLPSCTTGPSEGAAWFRPWLEHEDPQVQLAAARGVLSTGTPDSGADAAGAGRAVARALVVIGSGSLPDVPWWPGGRYQRVPRIAQLLAPHPDEAADLVAALAGHSRTELREAAVVAARARLRYWRDPAPELWETVAAGLDDESGVASESLDVFARGGAAAAPYADRLVRYVERYGDTRHSHSIGTAVRALAGMGDDRAAAWYADRFGKSYLRVDAPPARWAPELLPVFRSLLASGAEGGGEAEALRILAAWGPAAAPAAPELAALLTTPAARPAAEALGRIGPAASAETGGAAGSPAGVLAGLATGDTGRPGPRRRAAQTAAWAHWRLTGDPELALRECGAAARAGLGRPVLRYLADLGPLAAPYADAVRPLLTCPGEWSRVGAAEAWWPITGDAAPAVEALLPELAPLARHEFTPLALRTVGVLGAIGRPAAAALPALHAVTSSPRRYGGDILRDEELHRAAQQAVAGIG
ncbi:hypothetical protein AB0D54_14910 [Streptomyces xanthophaeus]|uniref:hypothetical protein n=1 Tax=Streptomyces xanthophaeus TaxID=67385 RepID=UPI0034381497